MIKKLALTLMFLGCALGAGFLGSQTIPNNIFSSNPIVSGLPIAQLNREQIKEVINNPASLSINIVSKDGKDGVINTEDFLVNPVNDNVYSKIISKTVLNSSTIPVKNLIKGNDLQVSYNSNKFNEQIDNLAAVNNPTVIPTINAHGKYNPLNNSFDIIPENIGTDVNKENLKNNILNKINQFDQEKIEVNLEAENLYQQPTITQYSPILLNRINKLNQAVQSQFTFLTQRSQFDIDGTIFGPWLYADENEKIQMHSEPFTEYINSISSYYDLYTSKEQALQEKRVLNGNLINIDQEVNKMVENINQAQCNTSQLENFDITIDDVANIYTTENQTHLEEVKNQLGPEFVYINLDQQFMWYFKDNNLIVATPITSGTKYSNDTPTGLFELAYKQRNTTLKGNNADGSKYESFVNYWMPFNGGIGIHDADGWRSDYGSDVYTYNGSHGCINTPREKVEIIFENISEGCPILLE